MSAFFRPFLLSALFFSFFPALLIHTACAAGGDTAASGRAMPPATPRETPRMIDRIESGSIAVNRWYWVGDWAAPTNTTMANPAKPWLAAEKAIPVSVASHYGRPEGGVWPFHGYLLEPLALADGKKGIVFTRKILLRHLVDRENITDEKTLLAMQLHEKAPGVFVYWKKGGKLTEFALEEAPFAKSYFRALVSMDENGTRTYRVNRVEAMPIQAVAYDYYPSGALKEATHVMRAQTGTALFFYTWKARYSDDLHNPQKTGETEKSLVRPGNPLWLPNMLKTGK